MAGLLVDAPPTSHLSATAAARRGPSLLQDPAPIAKPVTSFPTTILWTEPLVMRTLQFLLRSLFGLGLHYRPITAELLHPYLLPAAATVVGLLLMFWAEIEKWQIILWRTRM